MPTLLLRLIGPMQSWGTVSRFDERDTGREPSKSAVLGLVAGALGIDRADWAGLEPLTRLTMGVRHDRPGTLRRDFQTAGVGTGIIKANGKLSDAGVVSNRYYLADAAFLVGLEGEDRALLERIQSALQDPVWPPALGRKAYLPSEPVWLPDGIVDQPLVEALTGYPRIAHPRGYAASAEVTLSLESADGAGVLRMDQPIAAFAERRFGARYIQSHTITLAEEPAHVSG